MNAPLFTPQNNVQTNFKKLIHLSLFYAKNILKDVTFIAIILSGFILQIVKVAQTGEKIGIELLPTTYHMIDELGVFLLFIFILILFHTGEMVWKERQLKFSQIHDSMPISDSARLISKCLGLLMVFALLLVGLIVFSIGIQTLKGYYNYEITLYFKTLFSETFLMIISYTLLAFFVQSVVNHKFMGYAVLVIIFISVDFISDLGWEHSLVRFAGNSLGTYSDMNKYGHFVTPFVWRSFYWFGFTCALFVVAILFVPRGKDSSLKFRFKNSKLRLTKPVFISLLGFLLLFSISGCYIFYNTTILNHYSDSDDITAFNANYEKDLKQFEYKNQPKIIAVNLEVELYPATRDFTAKGFYYIKNKSNQAIADLHIQIDKRDELKCDEIKFDRKAKLINDYEKYGFYIYQFEQPLLVGDSLKMDFQMTFETKGFVDSNSDRRMVYNGTFINTNYFPSIGYTSEAELVSDDDRKKYGLAPRERMLNRTDPRGTNSSVLGINNGLINFEMTIGTSVDQTAIAPGYLQKKWTKNGRNYFMYKMDQPMDNFYSIVSANYQIIRDKWNNVNLEIYYHKGHEYNLKNMINSLKKSLDYYTTEFGLYQHKQLRIMEFPRYSEFAQSFANTIPFSEGMGFVMDLKDMDFDFPFYVTAHEVAHQWWGHQIYAANVKGAGMLEESITQYSALMVLKKNYPDEQMQKFLRYELDKYLRGRAQEVKYEMPLVKCEEQQYVHYRKGSLAFYALQDYISEDSVNLALRRFLKDWKFREDLHPTTLNFMKYLDDVTPDSLKYLLTDFFETITFYENKAVSASYTKANNKYYLDIELDSKKIKSDSIGNETSVSINDWIDIGVYGLKKGEEQLIYLKKHKITKDTRSITIELKQKPTKAGIDPINKLIDKHPEDNIVKTSPKQEKVNL
ncbi:MAG: hypothetical protein HC831_22450 [Chloroflexia bacterium]|nr:hypothetical protein [Chloroflexia bacterium]